MRAFIGKCVLSTALPAVMLRIARQTKHCQVILRLNSRSWGPAVGRVCNARRKNSTKAIKNLNNKNRFVFTPTAFALTVFSSICYNSQKVSYVKYIFFNLFYDIKREAYSPWIWITNLIETNNHTPLAHRLNTNGQLIVSLCDKSWQLWYNHESRKAVLMSIESKTVQKDER